MTWDRLRQVIRQIFGDELGEEGEPDCQISRREALAGLGLVGMAAFAGPMLLSSSEAEAGKRRRRRRHKRRRGRRRRHRRHFHRRRRRRRRRRRYYRRRHRHYRRRDFCIRVGPVVFCD